MSLTPLSLAHISGGALNSHTELPRAAPQAAVVRATRWQRRGHLELLTELRTRTILAAAASPLLSTPPAHVLPPPADADAADTVAAALAAVAGGSTTAAAVAAATSG